MPSLIGPSSAFAHSGRITQLPAPVAIAADVKAKLPSKRRRLRVLLNIRLDPLSPNQWVGDKRVAAAPPTGRDKNKANAPGGHRQGGVGAGPPDRPSPGEVDPPPPPPPGLRDKRAGAMGAGRRAGGRAEHPPHHET